MVNVGFAAKAMLAFVGFGTKKIGSVDFFNLIRFKIPFKQSTQIMD
jgi:hypothetical protein